MRGDLSIGVPGALGPDAIGALAVSVERAGFAGLWVNDTPGGDSLAGLAAAAAATTHLRLATGVIPVDRRPAPDILAAVERLAVPPDRLTLGIGSGAASRGAIDRVREATTILRDGTSAGVVVGALGPRMRALAAGQADGALLSWLPVTAAAEQAAEIRGGGRTPTPRVILYARTIVDEAARPVLEAESAGYDASGHYAANFARLGVHAVDTTLPRPGERLVDGVDAYRAVVDELVLRAITPDGTLPQLQDFVARAGDAL